MTTNTRPLAVVTGASTGIGYELAKCCAEHGFDLLVAADEPLIHKAVQDFRQIGIIADAIQADLATLEGVDKLYAAAHGRTVNALLANAGVGLGHGFLDQNFDEVRHVIDTKSRAQSISFKKLDWICEARPRADSDYRLYRRLYAGDVFGSL